MSIDSSISLITTCWGKWKFTVPIFYRGSSFSRLLNHNLLQAFTFQVLKIGEGRKYWWSCCWCFCSFERLIKDKLRFSKSWMTLKIEAKNLREMLLCSMLFLTQLKSVTDFFFQFWRCQRKLNSNQFHFKRASAAF